jgi:hypothetical protein
MQVNELYIPATQTYSKMEPAFTECDGNDYIIPFALGAVSRVIGGCQERHGDTGTCWGTFHSRDVDTRDTPWQCIKTANNTTNVCRVGAVSEPYTDSSSSSSSSSTPKSPKKSHTKTVSSQPQKNEASDVFRTLKNFPAARVASASTDAQRMANAQASHLKMSYDVYDSPFLKRGLQSTSDPAGWLTGVSTYNNLLQRAEMSSLTAAEPWGVCSSYGNYSSAPNSTLTSNNRCAGGNCVLGQYA